MTTVSCLIGQVSLIDSGPLNYYILLDALLCTVHDLSCLESNYSVFVSLAENMWSEYGPLAMLVENKKLIAVGGSDSAQDIYMPYVVNDITTFFTLLVGIYFPSVTGENMIKATHPNTL